MKRLKLILIQIRRLKLKRPKPFMMIEGEMLSMTQTIFGNSQIRLRLLWMLVIADYVQIKTLQGKRLCQIEQTIPKTHKLLNNKNILE
jgi:hypothetical protein